MKISAHRLIKLNLGNFENTDISFSMELEVNEGDDAAAIVKNQSSTATRPTLPVITKI